MKAVCFDMDGVLYNSEQQIDGACETVAWLRAREIPHLFVTNTSSRGPAWLVEKLQRFRIPAEPSQIITPSVAAAEWLRERKDPKLALFVRPNARAEFEGMEWVGEDAESGADYVVIGDLGEHWDFHTLTRAFRLLHANPAAELLSLGKTRFWQAEDGLRLDVAPFTAALECASGRKARVFGKPSREFFQAAIHKLGFPAGDILMVGDDIEVDIGGAIQAGMRGALVRTGKFRPGDLEHSVRPDYVITSVAELPAIWEQL